MSVEHREFRTARWLLGVLAGVCIGFALLAGFLYRAEGVTTTGIALGALAVLFAAGLVEGKMARVVLRPDHLEVVSNFRRIVVPRADIVRVVAEKGAPISLERASGGWIKLSGGVAGLHANTLRAWIKRSAASSNDGQDV